MPLENDPRRSGPSIDKCQVETMHDLLKPEAPVLMLRYMVNPYAEGVIDLSPG